MFDDSFLARFYAKIDIPTQLDGTPDRSKCWPWTGARSFGGGKERWPYGVIWFRGKPIRAHRVALAIVTGEMPAGMDAAHAETCVSGLCCNGAHLEWQEPVRNRYEEVVRRYRARLAVENSPSS